MGTERQPSVGLAGTVKGYNENAEVFSERGKAFFDGRHMNAFAALLPPNARVLDAGCGYGRDVYNLTKKHKLQAVGIDLAEKLLGKAREEHSTLPFVQGDIRTLPFPDQSFDGVWSNVALVHFETVEDAQKALSESNRVLRPGGWMHVLVKAQTGDEKFEVKTDSLSQFQRLFQYFKLEEMRGLLEGAGFEVEPERIMQYHETDIIPPERGGRSDVELIWALARKR